MRRQAVLVSCLQMIITESQSLRRSLRIQEVILHPWVFTYLIGRFLRKLLSECQTRVSATLVNILFRIYMRRAVEFLHMSLTDIGRMLELLPHTGRLIWSLSILFRYLICMRSSGESTRRVIRFRHSISQNMLRLREVS